MFGGRKSRHQCGVERPSDVLYRLAPCISKDSEKVVSLKDGDVPEADGVQQVSDGWLLTPDLYLL